MLKLRVFKMVFMLFFVGSSYVAQSATITRIVSDESDWNYAEGWDCNCIPSMVDDVIINGQYVTIDTYAEVRSITISSHANQPSALLVLGNGYLETATDINLISENGHVHDVMLFLQDQGSIDVNGSVFHTRAANHTGYGKLAIDLSGGAIFNILGDLVFSRQSGVLDETQFEMHLKDQSTVMVAGNFSATMSGGSDQEFVLEDDSDLVVLGDIEVFNQTNGFIGFFLSDFSQVNVNGTYNVHNSNGNPSTTSLTQILDNAKFLVFDDVNLTTELMFDHLNVEVAGQGIFHTANIVFDNVISNSISLDFIDQSELHITGNIDRTLGTGSIEMVDQSKIVFMGTEPQVMPSPYISDEDYTGDNILLNYVGVDNPNGITVEVSANGETAIDKIDLIQGAVYLTEQQSLKINNDGSDAVSFVDGGFIFLDEDDQFQSDKDVELENRSSADPFGSAVIWQTGLNTGAFQIPIMTDEGLNIPVTILTDQALGEIRVSTYETETTGAPNNRPLPNEVAHLDLDGAEAANSAVDRFWKIDSEFTNTMEVVFNYSEDDLLNNPLLEETNLELYSWDTASQSWGLIPNSTVDANANRIGADLSNANGIYMAASKSAIIPVDWISFIAEARGTTVKLDWSTASEVNSDYFEIQRSTDAKDWTSLNKVAASGFAYSKQDYTFVDQAPYAGVNYYRLKQYDTNGKFSFSSIVKANIDDSITGMNVFPNPVYGGTMNISFDKDLQTGSIINIYDSIGKLVRTEKIQDTSNRLIRLNIETLSNGIYHVEMTNPIFSLSKTFTKE